MAGPPPPLCPVVLLSLLCGGVCAACHVPEEQGTACPADPAEYGRAAFQTASGSRTSEVSAQLVLVLRITEAGEHFAFSPTVSANFGRVEEVTVRGARVDVRLALPAAGTYDGEVRLRGPVSGRYRGGVDRCPLDRVFSVRVNPASVVLRP